MVEKRLLRVTLGAGQDTRPALQAPLEIRGSSAGVPDYIVRGGATSAPGMKQCILAFKRLRQSAYISNPG